MANDLDLGVRSRTKRLSVALSFVDVDNPLNRTPITKEQAAEYCGELEKLWNMVADLLTKRRVVTASGITTGAILNQEDCNVIEVQVKKLQKLQEGERP